MRTTIDISDEAYVLAKAISRERRVGLGRAISDILLNLKTPSAPPEVGIEIVDGLPLTSVGRIITSEEVRAILEENG